MCKICTAHGAGKRWYLDATNYSQKLLDSEDRQSFIKDFLRNFDRQCKRAQIASKFPVLKQIGRSQLKKYSEKDHTGQVISLEDAKAIVNIVGKVFLTYCPCRRFLQNKLEMVCMTFSLVQEINDKVPPYSGGKYIDQEEAHELLEKLGKSGYVHSVWTMKNPFIGSICNCKDRSCMGMDLSNRFNFEFMIKGHEVAAVEPEACVGCGKCVKTCQFAGIKLYDKKAVVNSNCHGCGNCINDCPNDAIKLKIRE